MAATLSDLRHRQRGPFSGASSGPRLVRDYVRSGPKGKKPTSWAEQRPWGPTTPKFVPYAALILLTIVVVGGLVGVALAVGLSDPCPCDTIVAYTNGTVNNATSGTPILPGVPLTIAVLADQGLNRRAKDVLSMVRDQNASILWHVGDFDYIQAPKCWSKQIFSRLANDSTGGATLVLNYFGAYGNHEFDNGLWPLRGYSQRLRDQLHPTAAACCCTGRVGARATCVWQNVVMLQIAAGVTHCYSRSVGPWIRSELARLSDYPWKFCLFHTPKTEMQLGWAGNPEIGWDVYQACREGGAIILNGHDHRYARTHLMSSFGPVQTIASTANELNVSAGQSFAVISGLGGYGIRKANPSLLTNPWWAASLNKGDPDAGFGALFIEIGSTNVSGDPRRASAFFRTTAGAVIDHFTIQV